MSTIFLKVPNKHFPLFTLRLHPCTHKCEWITSQLATGTRDGPAAQQHQNSRVG